MQKNIKKSNFCTLHINFRKMSMHFWFYVIIIFSLEKNVFLDIGRFKKISKIDVDGTKFTFLYIFLHVHVPYNLHNTAMVLNRMFLKFFMQKI